MFWLTRFGIVLGALASAQTATPPAEKFTTETVFEGTFKPLSALRIDDHGKLVVEIGFDGSVTFGPGIKPRKAAKRFYEILAKQYAVCPTGTWTATANTKHGTDSK